MLRKKIIVPDDDNFYRSHLCNRLLNKDTDVA